VITVGTTTLPSPIQQLREQLEELGFWLAEEEHRDDGFGDLFLVLTRRGLGVRLIRDRGQWSVEVSGSDLNEWFAPMVWRAYLNQRVGDVATPTLDEQCQLVLDDVGRMQAAISTDVHLLDQLHRYRSDRAEARRRLGPS